MTYSWAHRKREATMQDDHLLRAQFNTLIRPYLVFRVGIVMVLTVFLIPLAVLWFFGVGQWWARHYFDKLSCELSDTQLRFTKGILLTVEKSVPLENIQDVTFIEGPILKHFQLSILKFETAGQSSGQANDMHLIGIIDAHDFRSQILARRQALRQRYNQAVSMTTSSDGEQVALLKNIDKQLADLLVLLKNRQS
jgi:membrane protein YdbS with pleckstrin-like domain